MGRYGQWMSMSGQSLSAVVSGVVDTIILCSLTLHSKPLPEK